MEDHLAAAKARPDLSRSRVRFGPMADDANPFKGRRTVSQSAPMNVLYRFTKPGGHRAEIRERNVTAFRSIEYLVFVDGALLESELFHNGREAEYPRALEARIKQFLDGGWIQEALQDLPRSEAPRIPPGPQDPKRQSHSCLR